MPPQVGKAGAGAAVPQTPIPENIKTGVGTIKTEMTSSATKAGDQDKQVSQNQNNTPQSTTASYRATKQESTNRKAEMSASGASQKAALEAKLKHSPRTQQQQKSASDAAMIDAAKKANAHVMKGIEKANDIIMEKKDPTGLRHGEKISARVSDKSDGFHFEFERPITKEQAGAIIFQDGKIPEHAKLEGSGKDWTVKIPSGAEARQKTTTHFNKREETIKIYDRKPTDVYQPEPEVTNTWTGGDLRTAGSRPTAQERRLDSKNEMGFTIKNKYEIDPGQPQYERVGLPGMGYEVAFDKPMTKTQVTDKLFDKEKVNKGGQIRLVPKSKEPASEWKVELIGVDAASAFKTESGHAFSKVGRAFSDANLHQKVSLPSDTPPGIRKHIENQTIPGNAEKLKQPAKDGKDVYVWEQDGYMMYVKTNNKGKDGYYESNAPTKMPEEKQGQIWMRHYVKEKGMEPREAWQAFTQDTADLAKGGIGMIGGAARAPQVLRAGNPKSSFDNSPPSSRGNAARINAHINQSKAGSPQIQEAPAKPPQQSQKGQFLDEQGVPVNVVYASNKQGPQDSNRIPDPAPDSPQQPAAARTAHAEKQTALNAKDELIALEKKGKITGNTSDLESRLRSNDPEVRQKAIEDFEEIKEEIKDGKKPDMEDYSSSYDRRTDKPKVQKISSVYGKAELRDSQWLINELGQSPMYRDRFMKWIERDHFGHGHDHLRPDSPEAREMLKRFRAEEGVEGRRD